MLHLIYQKSCQKWLQILLLAVAVLAVYGQTLDVPFYFDDNTSITENQAVKDLGDLASLWEYAGLRFVSYFTFALNYHFHGLELTGYHIVNILIHFLAGCSVFFLCRGIAQLPGGRMPEAAAAWFPFIAALLFVLHPLQTQAVTYIVQRVASLAALFYIGALTCYVQARSSGKGKQIAWFFCTGILAVLAILSKQNTVTLPFAFLLLEIVFFQTSLRKVGVGLFFVVLLLTVGYSISWFVFDFAPFSLDKMDSMTRESDIIPRYIYLATQATVVWAYIRLFFWPSGLNFDYDVALSEGFADPAVLAGLGGHLFVLGSALCMLRKLPFAAFAILFYYLAHLVESSVIPISDVMFEHRTYLPNMGLCVGLAWLLSYALAQWKKIPVLLVTAALLISLGSATWIRNSVWRNPIALWTDCVEHSPDKARPHNELGIVLSKNNRKEEGRKHFSRALQIDPDYAKAHFNIGISFMQTHNMKQAMYHLATAIRLYPDYAKAYNGLGIAYYMLGDKQTAVSYYKEALRLDPNLAVARKMLGLVEQ